MWLCCMLFIIMSYKHSTLVNHKSQDSQPQNIYKPTWWNLNQIVTKWKLNKPKVDDTNFTPAQKMWRKKIYLPMSTIFPYKYLLPISLFIWNSHTQTWRNIYIYIGYLSQMVLEIFKSPHFSPQMNQKIKHRLIDLKVWGLKRGFQQAQGSFMIKSYIFYIYIYILWSLRP